MRKLCKSLFSVQRWYEILKTVNGLLELKRSNDFCTSKFLRFNSAAHRFCRFRRQTVDEQITGIVVSHAFACGSGYYVFMPFRCDTVHRVSIGCYGSCPDWKIHKRIVNGWESLSWKYTRPIPFDLCSDESKNNRKSSTLALLAFVALRVRFDVRKNIQNDLCAWEYFCFVFRKWFLALFKW